MCTMEYAPVCGCDNHTYSNVCAAAAAGASVKSRGPCASGGEGATCGTRGAAACGPGFYCQYTDVAQCGATDMGGACTSTAPRMCAAIVAPVCGCDGRTYSNRCVAYSSSTSVKHDGACEGPSLGPR